MSVESEGVVGAFVFVDAVLVVNELHSLLFAFVWLSVPHNSPNLDLFVFSTLQVSKLKQQLHNRGHSTVHQQYALLSCACLGFNTRKSRLPREK